ncbi:MAG: hypothetical protein OXC07_06910, partial [Kistimonas sp.]|nr:hypothetical protein [Kistimonas sp.]
MDSPHVRLFGVGRWSTPSAVERSDATKAGDDHSNKLPLRSARGINFSRIPPDTSRRREKREKRRRKLAAWQHHKCRHGYTVATTILTQRALTQRALTQRA